MSNFDFILNIDNTKRLTNIENELCYDNSYISYFKNSSLEEPLNIIKNTLLKKLIEKQIIYKNQEYLEQINNCLNYSIENLKNINKNNIYSSEEFKEINKVIEFITNENENTNKLIEIEINKNKIKNKIIIEDEFDEALNNVNEETIFLTDNTNQNNYNFFDKLYSIAVKIKNAIQTGFKVSVTFISMHSRNFINNFRGNSY
jgi:hypothetical protein